MTAELVLRWAGGELNLMGWNPSDHGDFLIETLADGTDWGNPEPVRRTLRRFLLDGSASTKEYDDNRTIPLSLRVTAPDGMALASGEQSLGLIDGRRCELVWTPPDQFSVSSVFVVDFADLRHKMDDLAETRTPPERFYTLTLDCLPHAFSDQWTEVTALPQAVSTPTMVDDCSSLSGWTINGDTPGATLSIVSGQIAATLPAGTRSWSLSRAGSVSFSGARYLRVTIGYSAPLVRVSKTAGTGGFLGTTGLDTSGRLPQVAVDAGARVYDTGGAAVPALNFHFDYGVTLDQAVTVPLLDTLQKMSTVRTVASRQQISTIATPGALRTSGSIQVSGAAGLGDVLVYTGPAYDPTMSSGTVLGTARRTPSSTLLSGASDNLQSGSNVGQYRRPVSSLPRGAYAIWTRYRLSTTTPYLSLVANLRSADGSTVLASKVIGGMTLPATSGTDWALAPLAWDVLPGWNLPADSPLVLELEVTYPGPFSPGGPQIDEIMLFEIGTGSLTIVNAGAHQNLWLDAPSLELAEPRVLVGANRASAIPLHLADSVKSWGASHTFTPPITNIYAAATGASAVTVTGRFRAAHHTHAVTP